MRAKFLDLARALGEFGVWVRLHYVYPYPHVDQVIPLMADGNVLPYLDVPFQHASPAVLKRMRRPAAQEEDAGAHPAVAHRSARASTIRSTFIVGFPGETEEDFALLLEWLGEAELDRVGCFRYEPVAGAAANELGGPRPRRRQGRALAPLHAAPARRFPPSASSAGSAPASRSSSTRSA